jgi:riboflavin transporter FmnP
MSKKTKITLQVSGSAIFAAISIAISPLAAFLPRIGPGMAIFDPVSIIWIAAFLIFGPWAGIFCCAIGTFILFPFDPTAPIGPLMKFAATVILILIYVIALKLYKEDITSKKLKNLRNFAIWGLIAIVIRVILMTLLNIPAYIALLGTTEGLGYWLIFVVIVNPIQALADLAVPYLLIYSTNLDEKFEIW